MKIGIIGFGSLGKALVNGLINKNISLNENIFVCAKTDESIQIAIKEYNINASKDINDVIKNSDIIFLVIKGNVFEQISSDINTTDLGNKIFVSFMAGVTMERIKKAVGGIAVVRAMPSIAIANGTGIIGYTETDNQTIINIFDRLGYAFKIFEDDIEKITALSACGLGFAAYILEAFTLAGVKLGFDYHTSKNVIAHTFSSEIHSSNYSDIIKSVATEGGATEKGIDCFQESKIDDIIFQAIEKAYYTARGK